MVCLATKKWKLQGYDTFQGGNDAFYPLEGEYDDQAAAEQAALVRLAELEKTQPTQSSGGQSKDGIQDHVYVVRPDGTKYRFSGK